MTPVAVLASLIEEITGLHNAIPQAMENATSEHTLAYLQGAASAYSVVLDRLHVRLTTIVEADNAAFQAGR